MENYNFVTENSFLLEPYLDETEFLKQLRTIQTEEDYSDVIYNTEKRSTTTMLEPAECLELKEDSIMSDLNWNRIN